MAAAGEAQAMKSKNEQRNWSTNLAIMAVLGAVDGADTVLLPASFRAMEVSLGLDPTNLATLAMLQGVGMSFSGPFWGCLADNGYPRKRLLVAGTLTWSLLTFALANVSSFYMMIPLRLINGMALGMLTPVVQSLVAQEAKPSERGYCFGVIEFGKMIFGQMVATTAVAGVSNQILFGFEGWRLAFFCVAILSFVVACLVQRCFYEEPRPMNVHNLNPLAELGKFAGYLGNGTFMVVVLQGMFGCIPWFALSFLTMFLQYSGLSDTQAGLVSSALILGCGLGALIGGQLGDRLTQWSRWHGRAMTAQISVLLGIPFASLIFLAMPLEQESFYVQAFLTFGLGLVASWCATGCNRPVFLEIVSEDSRASAYAWLCCLELTCGSVIGPYSVGFISEHMFNYRPSGTLFDEMSEADRISNASALGKSLAVSTVVPWIVCLISVSFLHLTYRRDVQNAQKCDNVMTETRPIRPA